MFKQKVTSKYAITAKKKTYAVGDKVVFEGHGLCTVTDIKDKHTLVLRSDNNGVGLIVTPQQMGKVRDPISKSVANKILTNLKPTQSNHQTWNMRYRSLMDKIKDADAQGLADALQELAGLDGDRSFGERKMIDSSLTKLALELAVALERNPSQIEKEIHDKLFAKKRPDLKVVSQVEPIEHFKGDEWSILNERSHGIKGLIRVQPITKTAGSFNGRGSYDIFSGNKAAVENYVRSKYPNTNKIEFVE